MIQKKFLFDGEILFSISAMKPALLLSLTLVLSFASSLKASPPEKNAANGFNEYLTFDDNLVPAGWAITYPYGGPGRNAQVANQRFQIGQVDTYAALEKSEVLPGGSTRMHISFECYVKNIYWGMGYQIHLVMEDGSDFIAGLSKVGYGADQMDAYAGNSAGLEFLQDYTPRYGVFFFDAVFQSGQITITATRERNGKVFASATVPVPELDITQLTTIRLLGIMTTGNNRSPAWIDDALIEALP